jgi:hypothetical protein
LQDGPQHAATTSKRLVDESVIATTLWNLVPEFVAGRVLIKSRNTIVAPRLEQDPSVTGMAV